MPRQKRKLTKAEKAAKRKRRRETMIIFINGKQKRVPREPKIDGLPVDEYAWLNADPIWLLQNEMYAELHALYEAEQKSLNAPRQPMLPGIDWSEESQPPYDDQVPEVDDLPF